MLTFKVTTVGASEGFILNKEAKARLGVQKGDTLYLTEAPEEIGVRFKKLGSDSNLRSNRPSSI